MNLNDGAMMAVMVAAMASCSAATSYFDAEKTKASAGMDPRTACVRAAWNQADRIECIKAVK